MRTSLLIMSANAMAAFLDFAVGALIAGFFGIYFSVELAWYHLFIGGLLALLPDIDLLPSVFFGKSATFDHRQSLFHRPILVIPLATMIAAKPGGDMWALITFLAVLWHFIHDTQFFGKDYGIAWFWPLSKQFWSLVGSFTPPLTLSHHDWLNDNWLKSSKLARKELSFGCVALFISTQLIEWSLAQSFLSIILVIVSWLLVWNLASRSF